MEKPTNTLGDRKGNENHFASGDLAIDVIDIAHHRNGIGGAPFWIVRFVFDDDAGTERDTMIGIVFEDKYHVAVFDAAEAARGDIGFGSNSYRGDRFEPLLRQAVADWEASQ